MTQKSIVINHDDIDRLVKESIKEMLGLAAEGKPFMFVTGTGLQLYGGEQEKELQLRDHVVMTQRLVNEMNKFCLANLGKDFNTVAMEEVLRRDNLVPDQEVPDNSKVNEQAKKEK